MAKKKKHKKNRTVKYDPVSGMPELSDPVEYDPSSGMPILPPPEYDPLSGHPKMGVTRPKLVTDRRGEEGKPE